MTNNKTPKIEFDQNDQRPAGIAVIRKLSVREAADFLRLSKSFLDKRRLDGNGPRYLKLGRRVVYDIADLDAWAVGNKRQHTSEA